MTVLHHDAGPRQLAVLRVGVFLTWLVVVATTPVNAYASLPSELFEPQGFFRAVPIDWLTGSPTALATLKVLTMAGCVACVVGVRPFVPVAMATTAGLFLLDGLAKSIGGYANHAHVALLLITGVVALFPAADDLSVFRRRSPDRDPLLFVVPMVASSLLLVSTYLFVGLRRLVDAGPGLLVDDTIVVWVVRMSSEYAPYGFDAGLWVLDHRWLLYPLALGVAIVTVAEILSPLVLRFDPFRRGWLVVIVGFHVVSLFVLRVFFWEHLVLIAVLLTRFPDRWLATRSRQPHREASSAP